MTDKKSALWANAYHEAGHVVAALAFGKGMRRQGATIVPNGEALGSVSMLKHIPRNPPQVGLLTGRMRLRIEEDVIIKLAGGAAQRKFRRSSVRSYHVRSDQVNADRLLNYITGSERERHAYWRWLNVRAEDFVDVSFRCIQTKAVAKAPDGEEHLRGTHLRGTP